MFFIPYSYGSLKINTDIPIHQTGNYFDDTNREEQNHAGIQIDGLENIFMRNTSRHRFIETERFLFDRTDQKNQSDDRHCKDDQKHRKDSDNCDSAPIRFMISKKRNYQENKGTERIQNHMHNHCNENLTGLTINIPKEQPDTAREQELRQITMV